MSLYVNIGDNNMSLYVNLKGSNCIRIPGFDAPAELILQSLHGPAVWLHGSSPEKAQEIDSRYRLKMTQRS